MHAQPTAGPATEEARLGTLEALDRTPGLLDGLAGAIGARAGAVSVFGAPIERDGVTVIPVAGSRFGFGGGLTPCSSSPASWSRSAGTSHLA